MAPATVLVTGSQAAAKRDRTCVAQLNWSNSACWVVVDRMWMYCQSFPSVVIWSSGCSRCVYEGAEMLARALTRDSRKSHLPCCALCPRFAGKRTQTHILCLCHTDRCVFNLLRSTRQMRPSASWSMCAATARMIRGCSHRSLLSSRFALGERSAQTRPDFISQRCSSETSSRRCF